MILEILIGAQTVGFVVGVPLLHRYLTERVSNLAREQTEKALADHRHEQDRVLAEVNATHQKGIAEFGLYARKHHQVYAALYRRIREASDRFGWFYRFTMGPDFSTFTPDDVESYRSVNGLRMRDVAEPRRFAEAADTERLRKAMNSLEQKVRARDANRAFTRAKNIEALYELYLSDEVRTSLDVVRRYMANVYVSVRRDPDDHEDKGLEKHQVLEQAVRELYGVMRNELRRGVVPR